MKRVLLLTTHPLAPPWDSADKQIAISLSKNISGYRFIAFGRAGHPRGGEGLRIPIVSRDGRPGSLERAQISALATAIEPATALVHVIASIGPGFRRLASIRSRVPRAMRRPLIHTVPGVLDPEYLRGVTPLGVTVALSPTTAELLREHGFGDVRVIAPGLDLDRWPLALEPVADPPIVLFAGHADASGGASDTILGAGEAWRSGARFRLVLALRTRIGEDERTVVRHLRDLAAREGIDAEFMGVVPDMRPLVASASIVAMPARSLGGKADVPFVLLEAMATGRAVVVTDLPSLRSLGEPVARVGTADAAALGATISSLLASPDRRRELGTTARGVVKRDFSELVAAGRYVSLYQELIRR